MIYAVSILTIDPVTQATTGESFGPLTAWQVDAIKVLAGRPVAEHLFTAEDLAAVDAVQRGVTLVLGEG